MKSNKVVKFTLTAICMAVLSACGSDGDSKPAISSTTNTTTQQQQQAAAEAAAAKAAAEKATAEAAAAKAAAAKAAEEAAKQKAAADKVLADAAKAAADKAAAEKAAAEEAKKGALAGEDNAKANVYVPGQESNVGVKQVVLNTNAKGEKTSNFGLFEAGNKDVAGTPHAMNMELHSSLDTVVVVTTTDKAARAEKRGYLEDFDFRGSTTANAKDGTYLLQNIYLQQGSVEGGTTKTSATDPKGPKGALLKRALDDTKTETHGKGAGVAYVYQNDRANYTDYVGKVVKADGTTNTAVNNQAARDVKGTVAEMYGHLTFAEGTVADRNVTNDKPKNQAKLANLPLAAEGHSKVLNNVQYGRVTTHLNGHNVADYKPGVVEDTFVVNYGLQGQAGTEDHYIYRGVGNTTAAQLAALGNQKFTYEGHAVSYGLDNAYRKGYADRPNALGSNYSFVSGNHVTATVDTAKNTVTGNIHNKWFDNKTGKVTDAEFAKLVTFNGTLHSNGAITGTSTNEKTKAGGTFAATLFGNQAQEIGGSVASTDKTAGKAWGAVFGANRSLGKSDSGLNESTNAKSSK